MSNWKQLGKNKPQPIFLFFLIEIFLAAVKHPFVHIQIHKEQQ